MLTGDHVDQTGLIRHTIRPEPTSVKCFGSGEWCCIVRYGRSVDDGNDGRAV